jgi:dimethylamine monooxygenase subunit B
LYNEKKVKVIVKEIHQETPHVKRFVLASADGTNLPSYSGGSHITTYIETATKVISRPYSLLNGLEHRGSYQIAIRLSDQSKGGSLYWHNKVQVGDMLYISYPKNHFPLSFMAKHHVFYAAGIGITPFLSMMAELKQKGVSFELHYGSKSKQHCAFYKYLKETYPNQCHFYFSKDEGRRISQDTLYEHKIGTHIYFCGPANFISSFAEAANRIGYPTQSVHMERFTPQQPKELNSFQVKISNLKTINVSEKQSMLEALLDAGVAVPYSCRVGRCGTCELKVVEGKVVHYDSFLSDIEKENGNVILSCISRAKENEIVIKI